MDKLYHWYYFGIKICAPLLFALKVAETEIARRKLIHDLRCYYSASWIVGTIIGSALAALVFPITLYYTVRRVIAYATIPKERIADIKRRIREKEAKERAERERKRRLRRINARPASPIMVAVALEQLANGSDDIERNVRIVISCLPRLRQEDYDQDVAELRASARGSGTRKTGRKCTAKTPEHGDVTIAFDERHQDELDANSYRSRIGQYKVWRKDDDKIVFRHYFAAELTTQNLSAPIGKRSPLFGIVFDPESLEPRCFGDSVCIRTAKLFHAHLYNAILRPLWGEDSGEAVILGREFYVEI